MAIEPETGDLPPPPRRPRQDNHPDGAKLKPPEFRADLVMGLRFFSRLPAGDSPFEPPDLSRMALCLPFASVLIGLVPVLLLVGLSWLHLPTYFAATLAVAVVAIATGAMPEDALADAADGLFGGASLERRLEIMKDSRHGTYGVIALATYILARVTALGALAAHNPLAAGGVWLATMVIGRSGALWLTRALPPARPTGASATAGRVGRHSFWIGIGFAVVLVLVLAGPFAGVVGVAIALLAALAVALGWTETCRRLLGGQTGDLIGALQALIELAALTALMIFS